MLDPDSKFDFSDTVEDILDVAAEVVMETAPDPGSTRIERMARFIVGNLGDPGQPVEYQPGWVAAPAGDTTLWLTAAEACALASGLLRAAIRAAK